MSTINVLIVDDDPSVLRLLESALVNNGSSGPESFSPVVLEELPLGNPPGPVLEDAHGQFLSHALDSLLCPGVSPPSRK
ncbi:hypothetical protein JCM17380_44490 [Desulfosporosinus burensis]